MNTADVNRGYLKIEGAARAFNFVFKNKTVLDLDIFIVEIAWKYKNRESGFLANLGDLSRVVYLHGRISSNSSGIGVEKVIRTL